MESFFSPTTRVSLRTKLTSSTPEHYYSQNKENLWDSDVRKMKTVQLYILEEQFFGVFKCQFDF